VAFSIAIDDGPGSFSGRWIERAKELGIAYERIDCLRTDVVSRLARHGGLLWHFFHTNPAHLLVARHVIRAAEEMGLVVFPSTDTCWSFDNKVAQKYQLEAAGAPTPRTDCFFSEAAALEWIETAEFPRVMKLLRGAGSSNVRLVRDRDEARALVRRAFAGGLTGAGILPSDAHLLFTRAKERRDLFGVMRRLPWTLAQHWRNRRREPHERGYIYFQEFLPGNPFDVRVTVIGGRAFAFTRNVRRNDFRASGSGSIDYSLDRIDPECLRVAFRTAARLRLQSAAFDFVFDREHRPRVLEVSFGFVPKLVFDCPGYWDEELRFVEGHFWPQDAMLDDVVSAIGARRDAAANAASARARAPVG
jgi:hypothetical protein